MPIFRSKFENLFSNFKESRISLESIILNSSFYLDGFSTHIDIFLYFPKLLKIHVKLISWKSYFRKSYFKIFVESAEPNIKIYADSNDLEWSEQENSWDLDLSTYPNCLRRSSKNSINLLGYRCTFHLEHTQQTHFHCIGQGRLKTENTFCPVEKRYCIKYCALEINMYIK